MRLSSFLLLLAALAGVGWAWIFGPYYVDAWKMEDVVGTAVLSWANLNRARGEEELASGLRDREIPDYLNPQACDFYEEGSGFKTVDCAWFVDVHVPVVDQTRRLKFRVVKTANRDGRLEE